ncbi:MAG: MBL fold metallo-hydrolase [Verrucomicrobia bacterium]|nr:MBL fold metallo-hydrolase [Verrucomicrobiota bacterium]
MNSRQSHLTVWRWVLAGAAASATFLHAEEARFAKPVVLPNREVALGFTASNGTVYRIDTSKTLTSWLSMVSFPVAGGGIQHTDTAAPFASHSFYLAQQLTGSNLLTGDHLPTASGDVVIHPVNHASFALGWSNKVIYVDPANNSFAGLPKADLILFTHEHGDHFNQPALAGLTNTGAKVCATLKVYSLLSASLRSLTTALTHGASTNFFGIQIEAMPAYNLTSAFHSKGTNNNGYVLTIGGKRLYVPGDTEDTPEMRGLTNIDVAFLPMNQPYTMTVSQGVSAVNAFLPKIVYPFHYQPSTVTTDLNRFKQQVASNGVTEVRLRKWY